MTQRLPTPGGDDGDWGDILNSFLEVSLASDGTLNSNTVGTSQLQNNCVTNSQLDTTTQTILSSVASKYIKPSNGIPASDLASAVQSDLVSAGSAVQSVNGLTGSSITISASNVQAIPASQLGVSGGVAQLDSTGNVPASQLGNVSSSNIAAVKVTYDDSVTNIGATDLQDIVGKLQPLAINDSGNTYANTGGITSDLAALDAATVSNTAMAQGAMGVCQWVSGTGWPSVRPSYAVVRFSGPGATPSAWTASTSYQPWQPVWYNNALYAWTGGNVGSPVAGTSGTSFTAGNWQQIPVQPGDTLGFYL